MDDGWSNQRANAGPGRQPGIGNANMESAHGHIRQGHTKPGKYYGGGLMLQAKPTGRKGVTKAWWFRYQIDKRERVMGLGNARVLIRAKASEARKLLAAGIDPIAHRNAERMAARAAELHTATFRQCLDGFLTSQGDRWRTKHLEQAEFDGALLQDTVPSTLV